MLLTGGAAGLTKDKLRERRRCFSLPSAMAEQPSTVLRCEKVLCGIPEGNSVWTTVYAESTSLSCLNNKSTGIEG